jgi:hypothetical protein
MNSRKALIEGPLRLISLATLPFILLAAAILGAIAAKADVPTPSSGALEAGPYQQSTYGPECNPDWVAVASHGPQAPSAPSAFSGARGAAGAFASQGCALTTTTLVRDQAVCLAVHAIGRLRAGSVDQAEHLALCFVHPVA